MGRVLRYAVILCVVYGSMKIYKILQVPPVPTLQNEWWGPGVEKQVDTSIRPFKVNVGEKVLKDLKWRLENARPFTPPLEGVNFEYGFNTDTLSKIVDHWKTKYDWTQREKLFNKYPQFKTNIQGLDIHFLQVTPDMKRYHDKKIIPLLLLHGWPGSVREFYDIIPLLTTPRPGQDFVFEVIVPSLPGYGFSQGAAKPGLGATQVAVVMKNLMLRLGFSNFYIQGGDWGAMIVTYLATLFPEHVLGLHSNMCIVPNTLKATVLTAIGGIYPPWFVDMDYAHKLYPFSTKLANMLEESGYLHIQATKPDTIGVGLNESPIGLAAYILEKFSTGTNLTYKHVKDGGLTEKFTYDDLLDNVMLYWISNSFTTSARLYAESFSIAHIHLKMDDIPISEDVPCACMFLPHEITYQPDYILRLKYANLIRTSKYPIGGHFAAFENPELLAADLWAAYGEMEVIRKQKGRKL